CAVAAANWLLLPTTKRSKVYRSLSGASVVEGDPLPGPACAERCWTRWMVGGGGDSRRMGRGSCCESFAPPSCFTERRRRRPKTLSESAERRSAYLSSTQSAAKGFGVAMIRVSSEKATASVGASQVRYACSGSVAFASSR